MRPELSAVTESMAETRYEVLRDSIRSIGGRPTFHVFQYRGTRILYDLMTGSLIELDSGTFSLLKSIEAGDDERAAHLLFENNDLPSWDESVSKVEALRSLGLFTADNDGDEKQELSGLLQHNPRKMMLMVQPNCNLKCSYCYEVISGFHKTGTAMDSETGKKAVEFLIKRSGRRKELEITFFGGEPLMNFALIRELVQYSEDRGREIGKVFSYQLTTNGVLLTDEIIEFLVQKRFAVMLSIDGPPELSDIHRKDLGGKGVGKRALKNSKKLIAAQNEAGIRPAMIRTTMTHENHDSEMLYKYFAEQGFTRVMLGAASGRSTEKGEWDIDGNDILQMQGNFDQLIDQYISWLDGKGEKPAGAVSIPRNLSRFHQALAAPRSKAGIGCGVGRNMQAISRDGKIYPCHRYAGEDAFLLGTLDGGIDHNRVKQYYEDVLRIGKEHCSACWARKTCGGQCPWYISKSDGQVVGPDEESCNGIRTGHEKFLWLVNELHHRGAAVTEQPETDD